MAAENIVTATESNFQRGSPKFATTGFGGFLGGMVRPLQDDAPVLDELATEYNGKVKIAKVNIDDNQNLAAQFRVTAIPTLFIFKNGQVMEQMVGAKSKRDLKASLDKAAA